LGGFGQDWKIPDENIMLEMGDLSSPGTGKGKDMFTLSRVMIVLALAALPALAVLGCEGPALYCGNGLIELPEECDNGINNGTPYYCKSDCTGYPAMVSVSGNAFRFNEGVDARLDGARVSVLEFSDKRMTTEAPEGYFQFDDLPEGAEVTLTLEKPDINPEKSIHLIQTGTILLGAENVEQVTFQTVNYILYYMLAAGVGIEPDEEHACQMVTTVTRVGKSLYDPGAHGEEGATVTLEPPLPPEHGPIYFNSDVMPDRSLTETSDDGGVLFVNVPPGEYVWTAHKEGVEFTQVKMKCRAGWLVNASPPWGLQALE
jgi:hypothetical protein